MENKTETVIKIAEGWISINDRLPEISEDGESELVLCVGRKGTHRDEEGWEQYEIMRYVKLDMPDMKDSKGQWINYGWSNRWWDRNPDLYEVEYWMPLPKYPSDGGNFNNSTRT